MGRRSTGESRRWETRVFRVATALALLHGLDDAFLNRQPGVGPGQHAPAALLALLAGGAAIAWFPRLRPGVRAAIALSYGVLALANGMLHVVHVTDGGAAGSDVTGVLAAGAGAALVLLGAAIPFVHRGEPEKTRRRRWAHRAVAVVGGGVILFVLVVPASVAVVQTHKYREPVGAPPNAAYEAVTFRSADGLELSGWYRPSRNRAAVVVVHGGGGDRTGSVAHAELLARHGFGVLVYDSRGRGDSEGSPVSFGWGWPEDVAGALAFLQAREDVDPERIGGLGLSTGADVLIEVAAEDRDLKAVVADGATAGSFADYRNLAGLDAAAPFYLTMYTTARVLSGEAPGRPLKELVAEVSPTPLLLIATGGSLPAELDFNRIYAEAANEPVELWDLPDVDHTAAIRQRPAEYERRVAAFFGEALGVSGSRGAAALDTVRELAFVRGEAASTEIFVIREDGSGLRRLTRNRAADYSPIWSPDGSRILFGSNRDGDDELFVMDASGGNVRQLTRNRALDLTPQWSPDGRWIAFASDRGRPGEPEIWVMRADGRGARRLVVSASHPWQDRQYSPTWSPDGRRIVFTMAAEPENPELHVVGVDGRGLKRLTRTGGTLHEPADDTMPDWSADGRTIVFVSNRGGTTSDLWTMRADGSGQRPLSRRPRSDDWNPRLAPQGDEVAFTEHVLPGGPAWVAVIRADGTGARRLTRGSEPDWRPLG